MKKEEILANCIEEVRSGKSTVEDCIKRYPALGKELRAMLEIAVSIKPEETSPSAEFKARARLHLFDAEKQPAAVKTTNHFRSWFALTPVKVTASVLLVVLIFAAVGGGTVYAAQSSTPGDILYPVKTGAENIQLTFTTSPVAKARLYLQLAQKRINEMARQAKLNRNINPQSAETVTNLFDKALAELNIASNAQAINNTLSYLSVASLNEELELKQVVGSTAQTNQPVLQQIITETDRANMIAQVAYTNHTLLKQALTVTDTQLDAGQFKIEGTLLSVRSNSWDIGGTNIENVVYSGAIPAVGSSVELTGLVNDNQSFISSIAVSTDVPQVTEVEGQFEGTNQNGTANVSGIAVNIDSSNAQITPGDSVQLQGNTTDNKLNVTGKQSGTDKTTTIAGTLTAVDVAKGTITVQLTGRQVKVDISNAQIQNFADTTTLKIAGLKLLTGHEIRLEGLSKNGNVVSATLVQIRLVQ
ncbi:MAG: DUF5667 domain-containing protein [Dehalococcoidales bacterium]|jgi:hypothetical protein